MNHGAVTTARRFRVLIVEDDSDILEILSTLLVHRGYSVTTADDGYQALRRIAAEPPDIILLDVMMPGFDGWDVMAEMRDQALRTPIVVVSALDNARQRAMDFGAAAFLSKPFDLDDVLRLVENLVPKKPASASPNNGH